MKIVVDAMGGDNAPEVVIAGVIEALAEFDIHIILIGVESCIREELELYEYDSSRLEIVHAEEIVAMKDPAIVTIRKKRKSSITQGINLLKQDKGDAFISAGNTGAVVAAATINLGMLKGVDRPAIGLCIPSLESFSFLIDVGANTAAKPVHLKQSAIMAQAYMRQVMGIKKPTVGLLNIGAEATKGSAFEKETYKLLENNICNFIGNIEANQVYRGLCNCIICEGYTGNVVIKVSTGLFEVAGELMKREIKKKPMAILGALLMRQSLKQIKKSTDYSEYGGAPLLGVNGVVMISHGRSSAKAIKNTIRATIKEIENDLNGAIVKAIADSVKSDV